MANVEYAPDMSEFEAEFTAEPTVEGLESSKTILDLVGITSPDLGQQRIETASGTGSSNGVDLDGE